MAVKNLIIYGASSFTAQSIIKLTKKDELRIFAVSRSGAAIHSENITCISTSEFITYEFPPNCVGIYLASPPGNLAPNDVKSGIDASMLRFAEFIEKAKRCSCQKIIYASSFWQFDSDGFRAFPSNLYIALKNAMDELALFYSRDVNIISLVLFDSYGPGDQRKKIWSLLSAAATTGQSIALTAGEQIIYPIFSRDLAEAFLSVVNLPHQYGYQRYWVPGPQKISLRSAVELFCDTHKIRPKINWGQVDYDEHQVFDPYIGRLIPNWSAAITPEVGFAAIQYR